uniref:Uncharacterized protein n=1 Tax=Globodera rostochiensis TaxID=31243 RepID=A0A914GQD7_GLORO
MPYSPNWTKSNGYCFPNVFIQHLEQALDPAFVDRADLVRRIGNPAEAAIQLILETAIEELQRRSEKLTQLTGQKPPPIEFDSFLNAFEKIAKNSSPFQWIS